MKKIVLLNRSDAQKKHGGDITLMSSFESLLNKIGFDVTVIEDPFYDLSGIDSALIINLDRPLENYIFAKRCKALGVTVFIYALHHPLAGIELYLKRAELTGVRYGVSRIAQGRFYIYESILSLLRVLASFNWKCFFYPKAFFAKSALTYLVKNHFVLLTGEQERQYIESDFSLTIPKYAFLPHIFDVQTLKTTVLKQKKLVVCAGRIEPRKNQIMLLKVADRLPDYHFIFIGSKNPSASAYYKKYQVEISRLTNITVYDSLSVDDLRQILKRAEFFVSLSFFEVVSLTELEAYAADCKMVVSKFSYISDFVENDCISYVSPLDVEEVIIQIEELSRLPINPQIRDISFESGKAMSMSSQVIENKFLDIFKGMS